MIPLAFAASSPLIPILSTLASIAPSIVRHISGDRAASVTESVLNAVEVATGVTDPEEQKRVLEANAEAKAALGLRLKDIEMEEMELVMADKANARNREIQTGDHWTPRILAFTYSAAFFWLVFNIPTWASLEGFAKDIALIVIGALVSSLNTIKDYYFGSSAKQGQR